MTMGLVAGRGDEHRVIGCDSLIAGTGNFIESGETPELPDALDDRATIDHVVRLTVSDMPNALRLLENS